MNSHFYNNIIGNFITGNHNSLVLPSNISKIDVELLVDHISNILDKSQDKPIIDKCKNLIDILKGKVE